jgi:hypothetical protein
MQNFKTYLKEENSSDIILSIPLQFEPELHTSSRELEGMFKIETISKHIPNLSSSSGIFYHAHANEYNVTLAVKMSQHDLSSYQNYENFIDNFVKSIEQLINIDDIDIATTPKLKIKELPNFPIFAKHIIFGLVKPMSLHNIHKILRCDTLQIDYDERVTDSALGLVLIPGIRVLRFLDLLQDRSWIGIIQKHIHNKNKDVLECQEELITNGYRKYAKL